MQFNSIPFIFEFLPAFLLVYFCIRPELRRFTLVLFSLIFYGLSAGGRLWWLALLAGVTLYTYFVCRELARGRSGAVLSVGLLSLGAILTFFKLWQGGARLPAGMSFYMFQSAAYMIDVYRGRLKFSSSLLGFSEQLLLFPKLLSGPLMDPVQLQAGSENPPRRFAIVRSGLLTLILGLSLKVLLANRLGGLFGQLYVTGFQNVSTAYAWMALISWAMQLYFDFYGYSLMAIGLGRIIGYELPDNFREPYASRSVSEFYRRWHITLGAWFREYLYIPLGGNRKGTLRTIVNLAVVWLFTGLWHGVGGNYLLWAGMLFFLVVNERLWLGRLLKKTRVLCHVYTVFAILLTWVPFAVGDWNSMLLFAGRLFGRCAGQYNPADYLIWGRDFLPLLLAGVVLATPQPRKLWQRLKDRPVADVICFCLFWVVVFYIATSAQDPFLYFSF